MSLCLDQDSVAWIPFIMLWNLEALELWDKLASAGTETTFLHSQPLKPSTDISMWLSCIWQHVQDWKKRGYKEIIAKNFKTMILPDYMVDGMPLRVSEAEQLKTICDISVKKLVRKTKKVDVEKLVMTCHFGIWWVHIITCHLKSIYPHCCLVIKII